MVTAEVEIDDSYDINLLRFTGAFAFVYLAFILHAGIDHALCVVSITMGVLGFVEISAIITFLAELKRKVTHFM